MKKQKQSLDSSNSQIQSLLNEIPTTIPVKESNSLSLYKYNNGPFSTQDSQTTSSAQNHSNQALVQIREPRKIPKPTWHAPWKLMRVISGHLGWVRSIAVDPSNEWFATGAGDRLIKVISFFKNEMKLNYV